MTAKDAMRRKCLLIILGLVFLLGATVGLLSLQIYKNLPDVTILKTHYPHLSSRGTGLAPKVSFKPNPPKDWVYLKGISDLAIGAVLVSEDWAFYQHDGVDTLQLRKAIEESWKKGELKRGASTITQQVAKNLFLSREKTLERKLKELFIAFRMEEELSKNRILETYLNIAEWGQNIYGIKAASRFYFGKSPLELSAREGAFLAMLLPSPIRYSKAFLDGRSTEFVVKSVENILKKMKQAHFLDDESYQEAINEMLMVSEEVDKTSESGEDANSNYTDSEASGLRDTDLDLEASEEVEESSEE